MFECIVGDGVGDRGVCRNPDSITNRDGDCDRDNRRYGHGGGHG